MNTLALGRRKIGIEIGTVTMSKCYVNIQIWESWCRYLVCGTYEELETCSLNDPEQGFCPVKRELLSNNLFLIAVLL